MVVCSSKRALTALGGLVLTLATACGPLLNPPLVQPAPDSGTVAQPAAITAVKSDPGTTAVKPDAAATATKPRVSGPRAVPAARGSLTDTVSLDGIVTAQSQESLTFDVRRAIVDDIKVKLGDTVKQGDVVIDFNPGDLNRALQTAREHM